MSPFAAETRSVPGPQGSHVPHHSASACALAHTSGRPGLQRLAVPTHSDPKDKHECSLSSNPPSPEDPGGPDQA